MPRCKTPSMVPTTCSTTKVSTCAKRPIVNMHIMLAWEQCSISLSCLLRVGRYEWKNIFNQLGTNRYTERDGYNAQSNMIHDAEYYYSSRTTYNTQLTGKYAFDHAHLDWSAGYAYANRLLPDRRRYTLDNSVDIDKVALTTGNDVNREFTRLDEHIASGMVNYRYRFESITRRFHPELLTGAYAEYRTRNYSTRSFIYQWNPVNNTLPQGFQYLDLPTQLFIEANYGDTGLYLIDDTKLRNNYEGAT